INDYELVKKVHVTVIKLVLEFQNPFLPKDMVLLEAMLRKENQILAASSIGTINALIIPIDFVGNRFNTNQLYRLEKAFFGPAIETGWESVQSYYKKTSYNKLEFTGTITDVYKSDKRASYFTNLYNSGEDADHILIKEALEFLDEKIDYSEYDLN